MKIFFARGTKYSVLGTSKGMTLIEIMVVVSIIGLVMAMVTVNVMNRFAKAKIDLTKTQVKALEQSIDQYYLDNGSYPTTEQGLEALIHKPHSGRECKRYAPGGYIEGDKVPLDPWENEFYYESDGKTFNITSFGADGKEGGEGNDKDISLNEKKTVAGPPAQ